MSLEVEDRSNSTDIVTTCNVCQMSWLVWNPADDLVLFQIQLNGVTLVNIGMGESDGSGVVGNDVWNFVRANGFVYNFTELEVCFSSFNADEGKSSLFVVQKSIILSGLDDSEEIHNSDWEFGVSSDFMIDFKSCLFILSNHGDLSAVSC